MSSAITVRQQLALRPGALYGTEPRTLSFGRGSLFSFPLHSTSYEADAATVRIPSGIKLRLTSASVDAREMNEFLRTTGKTAGGGVSLRFSSEENGDMLAVCTFDGERGLDYSQTGLGIEGVCARCTSRRRSSMIFAPCSWGWLLRVRPSTEVPTPLADLH